MRTLIFVLTLCLIANIACAQEIKCVWDLAALDYKHYKNIFANKTVAPMLSDFRGNKFNGFILYVTNKKIGEIVYKLYTGKPCDSTLKLQSLTFQKRFYLYDNEKGESGINFWPVKGVLSMPMKIYISPCITNSRIDSLKIDYDVKSNNPITERILIDEVRQITNTNLYLGKMYSRIFGKPVFFLWFVLEKKQ